MQNTPVNQALAFLKQREYKQAETWARMALEKSPRDPNLLQLVAVTLSAQNRNEEAIPLLQRAAKSGQMTGELAYNLGTALNAVGRPGEAVRWLALAARERRGDPDTHNNFGLALLGVGHLKEAELAFRQALKLRPAWPMVHVNLSRALAGQRRPEDALDALVDARGHGHRETPELLIEEAILLRQVSKTDEALERYDRLAEIAPDNADALNNKGNLLLELGRPDEAMASFKAALQALPGQKFAKAGVIGAAQAACDWTEIEAWTADLAGRIDRGEIVLPPRSILALSMSASQQRAAANRFISEVYPNRPEPLWKKRKQTGPLKIAYLVRGLDPADHLLPIASLVECHDKEAFEVGIVCLQSRPTAEQHSILASQGVGAVDATSMSDFDAARALAASDADIVVDLCGLGPGGRVGVLAQRPAPVQIAYPGYPGTMGAPFADYVIADPIALPSEHATDYAETCLHLTAGYMAAVDQQADSEFVADRPAEGLPAGAFVYCCFATPAHVSSEMFAAWMKILDATEGSVLWLRDANPVARANLVAAAKTHNIDPARLVFADVPTRSDRRARYPLADLILDTVPLSDVEAVADALLCDVPALSCLGDTFAGRTSGSLLHQAGLAHLAPSSLPDYVEKAVELAQSETARKELAEHLATGDPARKLTDMKGLTRRLEAAYQEAWTAHKQRREKAAILIEDAPAATTG